MTKTCMLSLLLSTAVIALPVSGQSKSVPTVVVKGSDNPSAIPDGTAYSLFFASFLRSSSEPLDLYNRRLAAKLDHIGLSHSEGVVLLTAVNTYSNQVKQQEERTDTLRHHPLSPIQAQQLRSDRNALAMSTVATLQTQFGTDARQKIANYIANHVKPNATLIQRAK